MKPGWKQWLFPALGVVVFGGALVATPLLWAALDDWVQTQRNLVWSRVEQVLGRPVVYDRIAPNVFAALDFQNVRVTGSDGQPLVTASSIRLSLDWPSVFQGKFAQALRRVQLINAVVRLDAQRDKSILDHWAASLSGTDADSGTPLDIEGFNLSLRWTDGPTTITLDRGFVTLISGPREWSLRYRGALAAQDRAAKTSIALGLGGELVADRSFENFTARADVTQVKTTWFDLEPLTVQIAVSPAAVTVTKVSDRIPLDLQLVWNRPTGTWSVHGAADGFVPSRLIHFKQALGWAGAAAGSFTGRFSYQSTGELKFGGRALWPSGVLPAPLDRGPVLAEGELVTGSQLFQLQGFHLTSESLEVRFDGTFDPATLLPDGTLSLERWNLPGGGSARGALTMVRSGTRVDLAGQDLWWNALGSPSLSGWVERRGRLWAFGAQGPWAGTSGGDFGLEGTLDPQGTVLDVNARVGRLPVSLVVQELRTRVRGFDLPQDLLGLETNLEARVVLAPGRASVYDGSFSFADPLRPGRRAAGTLSWADRRLQLDLASARWDGISAQGSLTAGISSSGAVDWKVSATAWDRRFELSGDWDPAEKQLRFSGTPRLEGSARLLDSGAWTVEAVLDPVEIVNGWTLGLRLRAALDRNRWSLDADAVELKGRYPWNQEPFLLQGKLAADQDFVRLGDLVLTDGHSVLSGNLISTWTADFSQPWSGRVVFATPETSRETLELLWVLPSLSSGHLTLRASGIDLTRAGVSNLQGRLAVTAEGQFDQDAVTWSAQTALSEARWGDGPLGLRAQFSGDATHLKGRGVNLSANPLRIVDGDFDLDLAQKSWTANLGVGLRLGASDWNSAWKAAGNLPAGSEPLKFQVSGTNNQWSKRAFPDWTLVGNWSPAGWSASMGTGVSAHGTSDGSFSFQAKSPFPVSGQIVGQWQAATASVQASVKDLRVDLGLVKDLVNTPAFSVTGGQILGSFTLDGALSDPEVNGTLTLEGLTATSSFVRQAIGPVSVPVTLVGHRLVVDPVNVGTGGRSWLVSGAARLDHLLPEEYQLAIQVDPLSAVPVTYQYTGISAIGMATGLFVIRGTPLAVTFGGRLVLQDTTITLLDTPAATGAATSFGFNADLTLVTGRKVEFLWPNESLPLLRAVAATNQTLAVKANDVASTWSVVGRIAMKAGEINYLSRTFVVKEGQLGFQESQAKFDPKIDVRAEWRIRETSGTTTIGLRAEGSLSKFSPRFDASPYKSPEELQQLVGTTLALPTDYTKSITSETALSVASDVGTSFLLNPFEETVKKNFNLDLFTVKTEILKKTLLKGNDTLEASDYLDNTRLFFGKYVGDDLFLQGTLAFRQDNPAATQMSTKMVVEPEFQMEFQTPFFLLNWTLLPQHPETLFVADNTVTFRWNWSY